MSLSSIQIWTLAVRPKTLPAAAAPVLIGAAMAYGDGVHHEFFAFLCLLAALTIQIATNFVNDYFDHKKGTDTEERIGPIRVTQAGLVKPETMKLAIVLTFTLFAIISAVIIKRGGFVLLFLAIAAALSGYFYTAGRRPLGYLGLGELFVFIFFGPVAVAGTYYVQSLEMNTAVILAGFAPGFLSSAILTVNNLRDIEGDRASGKLTLAARFGERFAKNEYLFFILAAALMPILIYCITEDHIQTLFATVTALIAIPVINVVMTEKHGPTLNTALASTGKLLLIFSILFSVGWIL